MIKLFLILLVFVFSCSSSKNINNDENLTIAFGNGGGFVGIESKYYLKGDGTLSKIINKDTTILKQIPKESIAHFFNEAEVLKDYKYFKPENIYQFIEINNNRIVWGFNTNDLNNSVITLYNNLKTIIK